jgi:hypothetical protein
MVIVTYFFTNLNNEAADNPRERWQKKVWMLVPLHYGINLFFWIFTSLRRALRANPSESMMERTHDIWSYFGFDFIFVGVTVSIAASFFPKWKRNLIDRFPGLARRKHLSRVFALMVAQFPVQLVFFGEVMSCTIRNQAWSDYDSRQVKFNSYSNNCHALMYGLGPMTQFVAAVCIQYVVWGLYPRKDR